MFHDADDFSIQCVSPTTTVEQASMLLVREPTGAKISYQHKGESSFI
ncbi:MAG: hypothetical protein M3162_07285 [Thermoproteota archaeon]|nr:hypothetical protein [Thermoproteota archaeon]